MRFKDKIAIVTGATSGIGKEVATRFVAEGGSVHQWPRRFQGRGGREGD